MVNLPGRGESKVAGFKIKHLLSNKVDFSERMERW